MLFANGINLAAGTELITVGAQAPGMKITTRKVFPRKIVIDWSGFEMSGPEYADFLGKNQSGTHLYIDYDGTVWQFADLFDKVKRGGAIDRDAIWIVIQNKGEPPQDPEFPRGVFRMDSFHGSKHPVLCSNADQLDVLEALIALICESLQIAPRVPRDGDGEVLRHEVSMAMIKDHDTILVAAHLSKKTLSPGPGVIDILDELDEAHQEIMEVDDEDDEDDDDFEIPDDAFSKTIPDA